MLPSLFMLPLFLLCACLIVFCTLFLVFIHPLASLAECFGCSKISAGRKGLWMIVVMILSATTLMAISYQSPQTLGQVQDLISTPSPASASDQAAVLVSHAVPDPNSAPAGSHGSQPDSALLSEDDVDFHSVVERFDQNASVADHNAAAESKALATTFNPMDAFFKDSSDEVDSDASPEIDGGNPIAAPIQVNPFLK